MIKDVHLDPQDKIAEGVRILAAAVKATLGPQGRNVILQQTINHRPPVVTKDGVTVANDINLDEPVASEAVQILKQAAKKCNDEAGDGTTTATVLAEALYLEGRKVIGYGVNPIEMYHGMKTALGDVTAILSEEKREVSGVEDLKYVASIAANNDKETGRLIASAMDKVGIDGVIIVQESQGTTDELELTEGIQFDRGSESPYFTTSNLPYDICYEKSPKIFLIDDAVNSVRDLQQVLKYSNEKKSQVLIVASSFSSEVIRMILLNNHNGATTVCAVRAPENANFRRWFMEDLAIMSGCQVVTKDMNVDLANLSTPGNRPIEDFLGSVERIVCGERKTTIIIGSLDEERRQSIDKRISYIKNVMAQTDHDYTKQRHQQRIARLSGGIGRLYITAKTEPEMDQKKHRVEDALFATRAAVDEGILPGCGVALLRCSQRLQKGREDLSEDEQFGYQIVLKSLGVPFNEIFHNAGKDAKVHKRMLFQEQDDSFWLGYNLGSSTRNEYLEPKDLYHEGIVDPFKVVKSALECAVSVANLLLTTSVVVVNTPEQDAAIQEQLSRPARR